MNYWALNYQNKLVHVISDYPCDKHDEILYKRIMDKSPSSSIYNIIQYIGDKIEIDFRKTTPNSYAMTFTRNYIVYAKFYFPIHFDKSNKYSLVDVYNMNEVNIKQYKLCEHIPCPKTKCGYICNINKIMIDYNKLMNWNYQLGSRFLGIHGFESIIYGANMLCLIKKLALLMLEELNYKKLNNAHIDFIMSAPMYSINHSDILKNITDITNNMYHLSVLAGILTHDNDICKYLFDELSKSFYDDDYINISKHKTHIEYDKMFKQFYIMDKHTKTICIDILTMYFNNTLPDLCKPINDDDIDLNDMCVTDTHRLIYMLLSKLPDDVNRSLLHYLINSLK